MAVGDHISRLYCPASPNQREIVIHIYCSTGESPQFVTDSGVQKCGVLRLHLSTIPATTTQVQSAQQQTGGPLSMVNKREIETLMVFSETEISISAQDKSTGIIVRADVNFFDR